MDGPCSVGYKKIYTNRGPFWAAAAAFTGGGKGSQHHLLPEETQFVNVKETTMTRNSTAKTFAIGAVAALALGLAPLAKAERKECSVATLEGSFVRRDTGFVTAPPEIAGPLNGVHLVTFDGNGAFTSAGWSSLNGNVSESTGTGTYKVNPDCTGTYTSVSSTGRTGTAFFVITDNGNEMHILPTNTGSSINCLARKVFPVGNSKD
jgi:hypothetical protein